MAESTVSLPDLALFDPENITLPEMDDANLRVYSCSEINTLVLSIANYANLLSSEYGFGGIGIDMDSSDTFYYIYISEYSGKANLSAQMFGNCPPWPAISFLPFSAWKRSWARWLWQRTALILVVS